MTTISKSKKDLIDAISASIDSSSNNLVPLTYEPWNTAVSLKMELSEEMKTLIQKYVDEYLKTVLSKETIINF